MIFWMMIVWEDVVVWDSVTCRYVLLILVKRHATVAVLVTSKTLLSEERDT